MLKENVFTVYVIRVNGEQTFWASRTEISGLKLIAERVLVFSDDQTFRVSKDRPGDGKAWIERLHPSVERVLIDGTLMRFFVYRFADPGDLMAFRLRLDWEPCGEKCDEITLPL